MCHRELRAVLCLCVVSICVTAAATPAFAASAEGERGTRPLAAAAARTPDAVVVVTSLNVREGPGTEYAVTGHVVKGDELVALGRFKKCDWLKVMAPGGQSGWVSGKPQYVRLNVTCDSLTRGTFRPATGIILPPANARGQGELTVINRRSTDVLMMLVQQESPVAAAYVRTSDTSTITGIVDGQYDLCYTSGSEWDGQRFTQAAFYRRFDDTLGFETTDTTYTTFEVTLNPVSQGNATTTTVPEDEFPSLGAE